MFPEVFAVLNGDSSVADIVDDRIYRHGEAPEKVTAPYVTWFVVSAPPENVLDGSPPCDRYELQIDCWSENDGDGDAKIVELAQAVRNAMEAQHYMTGVTANGKDPETRRYRVGMGFTWWLNR